MESKSIWNVYNDSQLEELEKFASSYKVFLNEGKTERECVDTIVNRVAAAGYVELEQAVAAGKTLKAGSKIYAVCMNKAVVLYQIGTEPLSKGMNILGAHLDSPRLDIKQNPLYEEDGLAYLDTHYYGGIKKYQWVTIPLAIHGVVVQKDGTTVIVNIGDEEDDPVFFVSDLLIHLSGEQLEKKASKVIEGEALDIIVGNKPIRLEKGGDQEKAASKEDAAAAKDSVKKGILAILKDRYGMEEEDFISAELEVVPAGRAKDAGFDRSMIMAYGHDDRVCSFASLEAMLNVRDVVRTTCCILVDKEEIGSVGATGMQSRFFENTLAELLQLTGKEKVPVDLLLRRTLANSRMLSSDVGAGYDPSFASVFDKRNVAYIGNGMLIKKFTGARGKAGSNDANAEYIAGIRDLFAKADIHFQTAEMGKVDAGGGGTIAYILSLYGMDVIDCGVPVLNMHAPFEVISKADLFEAKRGYEAFLQW